MAEKVAPPPAEAETTAASTTSTKPEKPDETKYKADLAAAEKAHAAAQEKFVCRFLLAEQTEWAFV